MTRLFYRNRGFVRAKLYAKFGYPVYFIKFEDLKSAQEAMQKMQGYVPPGSKRNCGIRIEYARQRMGKFSLSPISTSSPVHMSGSGEGVSPTLRMPSQHHISQYTSDHNGCMETPVNTPFSGLGSGSYVLPGSVIFSQSPYYNLQGLQHNGYSNAALLHLNSSFR